MIRSRDDIRWKIGYRAGAALIQRHLQGKMTHLTTSSLVCARHIDQRAPYKYVGNSCALTLYDPIWSLHSNGWARAKGDIKRFISHLNRGGWTDYFGPPERGMIDAILDSVGC